MQALEKVTKQGKAEALKSTEEFGVQVKEKAKKRDVAEKRAAETNVNDAKQRAEDAVKTAAQDKKREQSQKKAEDKAAAKAVAVKKADEEKAYASFKVDKAKRLLMRLMPQNKLRE